MHNLLVEKKPSCLQNSAILFSLVKIKQSRLIHKSRNVFFLLMYHNVPFNFYDDFCIIRNKMCFFKLKMLRKRKLQSLHYVFLERQQHRKSCCKINLFLINVSGKKTKQMIKFAYNFPVKKYKHVQTKALSSYSRIEKDENYVNL